MIKRRIGSFQANIWKMYVLKLLYNTYFYSAIIVPFYTEWGGIKFSRILFLNAWFMFWNFLLEIPTGTVADFLGRKVSLILGCIIGAAGVLIYVSYPHFVVFLFAEVILSLSYTLLSGADEALVYDSLKEINQTHISKKVFSRLESLKLTGIVIGAISGGFIAKHLGLRMPMIFQAIPLAAAGVLAASLKEPEISEKTPKVSFSAYRKILTDGVKYFWRCKILKMLTLDMVIVFAFAWIIIWFYQALLKNAGIDIAYFGIVHAFMSLSQIVIINNFVRMEKWLGSKKRLLFFSAFLTGIFFIMLGITRFAPLVIGGILLSAGFGLSRGPLFSSYMNKYIPSDKRATILSTTSMLRTFSIVVVNSVSGLLADWSIPNTLLILGIGTIAFSFLSKIKEEDLVD
ncbi:MAG: MFS transporter [Candidatus Aminicenantes bacterium]|nr:MAG: MFS transporter [Candidatus Aminicenantes bacterium]